MSATDLKGVIYLCSQVATANCDVVGCDKKSLLNDGWSSAPCRRSASTKNTIGSTSEPGLGGQGQKQY